MNDAEKTGRENQKRRTRKDLLQAAARLIKQGQKPTLEAIADEALVSRATAYRYFPSLESLLVEASIDVTIPDAVEIFRGAPTTDPAARIERVDSALHDVILANEAQLRIMLAYSLQRDGAAGPNGEIPPRQDRRTPLIEAALGPARDQFKPAALKSLMKALAVIIGTEGMVVFKDVLQLEDAEARKVKRWAIRALVDAAKK
jgi:AcrR family transcriptional regulator